ncbi:hypothetical protein HanRHA438_Chr08g0367361 [Helianthus annuus]|nr:hypothetical protein HanIR_Chr08g0383311 [Helianthus annuus]KAJ0723535.1 hypothetical protein HanOQP8_Chr08g0299491 [Helianthus annuus]KAJ0899337.1 hypothetical protein HanRHA438_Chr08g0367361 [Helianthus annuus]
MWMGWWVLMVVVGLRVPVGVVMVDGVVGVRFPVGVVTGDGGDGGSEKYSRW